MCWTMYHPSTGSGNVDTPGNSFNGAHLYVQTVFEKEKVDLLTGKYLFDLDYMYQIAWDCKEARGSGGREVDVKTLPYDGTLPTCFFNIDVVEGEFNVVSGRVEDKPR
jgi:hypothetical protein